MIEGLKVTVPGPELRDLCMKQAEFHRERAGFYSTKAQALEGVPSNGPHYSGQDPRQQMQSKLAEHENATRELEFIAAHLIDSENYLLAAQDLQRIGIVRRHVF